MRYYATLGPNFHEVEDLVKATKIGLDGLRLNLSHGLLQDRQEWLENINQAYAITGKKLELILDICGNELRIKITEPFKLLENDLIKLAIKGNEPIQEKTIYVEKVLYEEFAIEDKLSVDDGKLKLEIVELANDFCTARALNDAMLEDNKSVSIMNKLLKLESVSEVDIKNFNFSKKYDIKSFMVPFVRTKDDLIFLKNELNRLSIENFIIYSKIEDRMGIDNLDEIIDYSDVIVIARGDLGNNLGIFELPKIQKDIAYVCNKKNSKFMVVTQLLNSMIDNPSPTRAELNDIYNSCLDGASMLMITGETAIGKYPIKAIEALILASKI